MRGFLLEARMTIAYSPPKQKRCAHPERTRRGGRPTRASLKTASSTLTYGCRVVFACPIAAMKRIVILVAGLAGAAVISPASAFMFADGTTAQCVAGGRVVAEKIAQLGDPAV